MPDPSPHISRVDLVRYSNGLVMTPDALGAWVKWDEVEDLFEQYENLRIHEERLASLFAETTESTPHKRLAEMAWSRIDTTKTEDMVPSSELRRWLVDYLDLYEQLEALRTRVDTELRGLEEWAGEQNAGNAFAEQVRYWALARLEDLNPAKEPDA